MRGLIAAGWVSFALIVIVGGGQFLFACDFEMGGWHWNACPARADTGAMDTEAARGEKLQRQIHAAELEVVREPICEIPKANGEFVQLQKRTYERGAMSGKLEVFLAWHTLDDVDLEVECPGGKITGVGDHFGPGICGDGKLDLDANRSLTINVQRDPIEHVAWLKAPPYGEYFFSAHIFMVHDPERPKNIPFEMTVSLDGEQKKCSGSLEWIPRSLGVKAPRGGILATRILGLRWKSGDPLPKCDWQSRDATFCDGSCSKN